MTAQALAFHELKKRLNYLEYQHNTLTTICTVLARELKDLKKKNNLNVSNEIVDLNKKELPEIKEVHLTKKKKKKTIIVEESESEESESEEEIIIKKKRGRKPKQETKSPTESPNKRGRKPKQPVVEVTEKKKRGRKPKQPVVETEEAEDNDNNTIEIVDSMT